LIFQFSCGQNADELNQQSKVLVQQGKCMEAFPVLKNSAELGNSEAQYNLGYFLQIGAVGVKTKKRQFNGIKNPLKMVLIMGITQ